ncbi:PP2C family protein-serine/threonine phosphatase [Streptomyces phaeofaciens]|uniref:PP2C family protein-serine/threonine phosphatase n=1 Tax=Streptomyces phaeofaciens TaxID=68254 RepID=UPI0036CCB0F0
MAHLFKAFRRPKAPEPGRAGEGSADISVMRPSFLTVLRQALAQVGTTLDEGYTYVELTRQVTAQVRGAAAVLRAPSRTRTMQYEAVVGNAALLPDAAWVTVSAEKDGSPERTGVVPGVEGKKATRTVRVPIAAHREIYGILVCCRDEENFTLEEREFVALLAEQAASHIRHAREHEAVRGIVGKLQQALLTDPGRPHPNLHVAIRYLPVGQRTVVGGDWCETVRLHFGRTLLVVGDVMGHGLEAAVDMTAYRSLLRYMASADLPPHRILRQLDAVASGQEGRRPATCLIARVDPVRGLVNLSSAGHLPPALIDNKGRAMLLTVPVGPPLGTGLGGYEAVTHRLEAAQTLLLFTDGLVERRGEDIEESLQRLANIDFSSSSGVEGVIDTALARLDAGHAEDDVAVMATRLENRSHPRTTPGD